MRTATVVAQNLVRLLGLVLIVVGILLWTREDYTESLVRVHMQLGVALVLVLWIMAAIGIRARAGFGLVLGAVIWGFIVAVFGMSLRRLLGTSPSPEIYRVLHLLAGLVAIGLAESLGARIKRSIRAVR
ncbi:MAG: hypothetical protein JO270_02425 [Acidobacteriaceae bacterium]|nr:hypothetical protein [Acidobacteriaceae bacterium]MBV8573389.1 hypothetical protein [Acidobacteriaceae bacterium]